MLRENVIVSQGPIIPVPAHWDPTSSSDVVPRRGLQPTRNAPEEVLAPAARRGGLGWLGGERGAGFGVGTALLNRRSKHFSALPCLYVGGRPCKELMQSDGTSLFRPLVFPIYLLQW